MISSKFFKLSYNKENNKCQKSNNILTQDTSNQSTNNFTPQMDITNYEGNYIRNQRGIDIFHRPISIITHNIRGGFINKKLDIMNYINDHNVDLAILTESRVHESTFINNDKFYHKVPFNDKG